VQPLPSDVVTVYPAPAAERAHVRLSERLPLVYAAAAAGILILAWAGPIARRMINDGDFPFHLRSAEQFAAIGRITVPHFLLQVTLGSLYATGWFPTVDAAGLAFFYVVHVLTAIVVLWFIAGSSRHPASLAASVILAVGVLMSGPWLPRDVEPDMFLSGYFPANAYHNPTLLVAKPLLVLFFASALAALMRTGAPSGRELTASAAVSALVGVAKPNYLGCLVPLLSLIVGFRLWRERTVCWRRASFVIGAAALTVGASYAMYRSDRLGFESGIILAPFTVIGLHTSSAPASIAGKLLASIVFPLVVVAMWPGASWRSASMRLAWGAFAIGLFFSYFIAESGTRLGDGNFVWSGHMAVFVLFVVSAAFVRGELARERWWPGLARGAIVAIAFGLHVESGIRHVLVKLEPVQWGRWWL
jgi:hypothetical protein